MNDTDSGKPAEKILDRPLDRVAHDPEAEGMAAVSLTVLAGGGPSPVDVFLPVIDDQTDKAEMTQICQRGQEINPEWWTRLKKAGQKSVCVRMEDTAALAEHVERRATQVIGDSSVPFAVKAELFQEMASLSVRQFFDGDTRDPQKIEAASQMARRTVGYFLKDEDVLDNLAGVLKTSNTVYTHSVNVCLLSLALGRHMGMDKDKIKMLGLGSLLHDVGMARLPRDILNKPEALDDEEKAQMQKHPRWGHQMLSRVSTIPYEVLNIVLCHHERPDGGGYPSGHATSNISYLARLVRVVDIYDALTSPRPYRGALPAVEAAATLIKEAGDNLDKEIVVRFIRLHQTSFA